MADTKMSKPKNYAESAALFTSGATLLFIGLSISLSPAAFYAASGIDLGESASLISELRAPAGMLTSAGSFILLSIRLAYLRVHAWLISSFVYLPYGIARLLGFAAEGLPNESLIAAAAIELVLGSVSIAMLVRKKGACTANAARAVQNA